MKTKILKILDELKINYKNYEHCPVFSCDEAKGIDIPGRRVKSLLLRNKRATKYYMVVLEDDEKLDWKKLRAELWENKMTFASEERMVNKIWVKPWHVSPFALINDEEKDVEVIFNKTLENILIWFHPGQNDNTVVLNMSDVENFLEKLWNKFTYLEL